MPASFSPHPQLDPRSAPAILAREGSAIIHDDSEEQIAWLADKIVPLEPGLRRKLASWRLPHGLEIDDIVQECYAKLVAAPDFASIRSPGSYLNRVAYSIVLQHVRHMRIVPITSVADLEDLALRSDEPSPEEVTADRQQFHLLAQTLLDFSATTRTVFDLRIVHELSYREISQRLGISENAAQKQLTKCLKILMSRLGRGENGGAGASRESGGPAPLRKSDRWDDGSDRIIEHD